MAQPFQGETLQGRERHWAAETRGSWPEGESSQGITVRLGAKPEGAGTACNLARLPVWHDPRFGTAYDLVWPIVWHSS